MPDIAEDRARPIIAPPASTIAAPPIAPAIRPAIVIAGPIDMTVVIGAIGEGVNHRSIRD